MARHAQCVSCVFVVCECFSFVYDILWLEFGLCEIVTDANAISQIILGRIDRLKASSTGSSTYACILALCFATI